MMATREGSESVNQGRRRLLSTAAVGVAGFALAGGLFPALVQQLTVDAMPTINPRADGARPECTRLRREPAAHGIKCAKTVLVE